MLILGAKGNRREELVNFLANYRANTADTPVALEEGTCAFVKFLDDTSAAEFQSSMDYANILLQSVLEETGIKAKIGVGRNRQKPDGRLFLLSAGDDRDPDVFVRGRRGDSLL